ncbi:MAG: hypothetical protein QM689_09230 [Oscillospiraceae bacterium]
MHRKTDYEKWVERWEKYGNAILEDNTAGKLKYMREENKAHLKDLKNKNVHFNMSPEKRRSEISRFEKIVKNEKGSK